MRRWGDLVTAEQHCSSEAALDFKMQRLNSPNVLYVSSFAQSESYASSWFTKLERQKQDMLQDSDDLHTSSQ